MTEAAFGPRSHVHCTCCLWGPDLQPYQCQWWSLFGRFNDTYMWKQPVTTQTRYCLTLCPGLKSTHCGQSWTFVIQLRVLSYAFTRCGLYIECYFCVQGQCCELWGLNTCFWTSSCCLYLRAQSWDWNYIVILASEPWIQFNRPVLYVWNEEEPQGPLILKSAFVFEVSWFSVLFFYDWADCHVYLMVKEPTRLAKTIAAESAVLFSFTHLKPVVIS